VVLIYRFALKCLTPTLQPAPGKAERDGQREAFLAIERFLRASRIPVLIESGEQPFALAPNSYAVSARANGILIECWDLRRCLARRIRGVKLEKTGRLELEVERFGGKSGTITLADLSQAGNHHVLQRANRRQYREQFRESLARQFPEWRIVELSTEPDLEHSFSPVYPRALLRRGTKAMAAIGVSQNAANPEAALSFGLIWLSHLRRREARLSVDALAIFVPAGQESTTCSRVRMLHPRIARIFVFVHDGETWERRVDPADYTNLDTRLNLFPAVESGERERLPPPGRISPLESEAMLESRVRNSIEQLDATLLPTPVYGQVAHFAGGDRGFMDLLAVDRAGRLAVLELKVTQDIHLPLQALDYWIRIKWHLDRGEFSARGYFPGTILRSQPPRLLLVAPAFEFHPSNETILSYFAPEVEVERIGLGIEWKREMKVVLRDYGRLPS